MHQYEGMIKNWMDLFSNPLFKAGFAEFTQKAQMEGLDAAKKFWSLSEYGRHFPMPEDMLERMTDWYAAMGFVPNAKYHQLMQENAKLQAENQSLRNMIKDMQLKLFSEGGERVQQAWQDIIDKQIKANTEITSSFFEAIRNFKVGG